MNTEILQGSLVLSILFLFFISDLLDIVNNEALRISRSDFVDNINLLIYSLIIERNCRALEETYRKYKY